MRRIANPLGVRAAARVGRGLRRISAPGSSPTDKVGVGTDPDPGLEDPTSPTSRFRGGPTIDFAPTGPTKQCPDFQRTIELPPFLQLAAATQMCFSAEYGKRAWPDTDCCPPELGHALGVPRQCVAPTAAQAAVGARLIPNYANRYAQDPNKFDPNCTRPQAPTGEDEQFFGAAVAVLVDNLDIAEWVVCQVASWSKELDGYDELGTHSVVAAFQQLTTPARSGHFPIHVTYVDHPCADEKGNESTAWAFTLRQPAWDGTLGVILPIGHSHWIEQRDRYIRDGRSAFCSTVDYAGIILHELIHVLADGHVNPSYRHRWGSWSNSAGALHDEPDGQFDDPNVWPCWDEARMVATMFYWAMDQRYTCLGVGSCSKYSDTWRFAHSSAGV